MANQSPQARRKQNTLKLVQLAILIAIELIIAFTPLGSLPTGLNPIPATLAHIPVILAAVIIGTDGGAIMGFVFGLLSFIWWSINYLPVSFIFTPVHDGGNFYSILICFVPRILLGVICGLLVKAFMKFDKKKGLIAIPLAAFIATIMHTILVMTGIYVFFGADAISALYGNDLAKGFFYFLLVTLGTNGLIESILAILIAVAFAKVLPAIIKKRN